MAKDDYEIIVYKILVYYYACMKRKALYDKDIFRKTICKDVESDEYLTDVLITMQEDGLIRGIETTGAWGNVRILISDLSDVRITSAGISFLKDNSKMQKVKNILIETVDVVGSLIKILGL